LGVPLSRDRCVCLRKLDYSETSQILLLFGREHGLLRVIAKGAHRRTKAGASKFDGGLDLLDVGEAVFIFDPSKELNLLTEWGLREGHLELRSSLRAVYLAQYAAELIALLFQEHDPHPQLFDRLLQTIPELPSPRAEEAFLAFELDLLRESGYLPELGRCGECGSPAGGDEQAYFSADRGGVVCRNCEGTVPDRMSLDARLLRLVQGVLRLPRAGGGNGSASAAPPQRLPRLTRYQTDPINRLLAGHVEHTLGRRLRLSAYVLNGVG
jgi:DNA repair protein RecO (recombination protein O)